MKNWLYKLDNTTPVPVEDVHEWAAWMERRNNKVCDTWENDVHVSTVFLGIDISSDSEEPQLFETMVFGGVRDRACYRTATWREAEEMHEKICKELAL